MSDKDTTILRYFSTHTKTISGSSNALVVGKHASKRIVHFVHLQVDCPTTNEKRGHRVDFFSVDRAVASYQFESSCEVNDVSAKKIKIEKIFSYCYQRFFKK